MLFDSEGSFGLELVVGVEGAYAFACSEDVGVLGRAVGRGSQCVFLVVLDELLQLHIIITVTFFNIKTFLSLNSHHFILIEPFFPFLLFFKSKVLFLLIIITINSNIK